MSRIMQVFYGNDCLPYKDKDRQVHFPIVGSGLIGSSNVNEIRFYVRDIGGVNDVAWVVVAKLPNGRQVFQVLSTIVLDTEINEYYLKFPIASAFTQLKGKVYFSLNGYRGNVSISTDSQTNIQTIVVAPGSQQIMTTGTVDISFNYSVVRAQGEELGVDQFTQIMTALADKSNIANTIQVVDSIVNVTASDYENGQIFYALDDKKYWQLYVDENEARFMYLFDNVGSLNKELQLCRYDFSDFLTATVQHIFNDLFHSNYFIAKDGSGNEIICRIRARIGVPPVYDIYGFGVDDDGKLFTKTILNRDSSYTIGAFFVDTYHKTSFVNYIDESNILYGNSNINKAIGVLFGTPVYEGFVVQRDSGGQINLPETPVLDIHAASKKYVDDKVKEFGQLSIQEVDITTYPTLNSFLASTGQEGYEYYYPIDTTEAPTFTSGYYRYVWENNAWLSLGTTQVDLSNYVPYTGATNNVDLGNHYLRANILHVGKDSTDSLAITSPKIISQVDYSALFTKRQNNSLACQVKLPIRTGFVAMQEDLDSTNVELNKLKAMFYETTVEIKNYTAEYSYEFDLPTSISSQPTIFSAGADVDYIEGNSYAYNQLNSTPTGDSLPYWNPIATFNVIQGHTYLIIMKFTRASEDVNTDYSVYMTGMEASTVYNLSGGNKNTWVLDTAVATGECQIVTATYETYQGSCGYDCRVVDLTQWFGGASLIPSDLMDEPKLFTTKYWNGTLAYGNNLIINSQPTSIVSIGANHFNISVATVQSDITKTTTGISFVNTLGDGNPKTLSLKVSDFFKNIKAGETYVFTCDAINQKYNEFYLVGSGTDWTFGTAHTFTQEELDGIILVYGLYNETCTLSNCMLTKGSSALSYKPYQANTYPITTNVLRSAGNVKDNTQIKKVGYVDLGTLTWNYVSEKFVAEMPSDCIASTGDGDGNENGICSRYANQYDKPVEIYDNQVDKAFIYNSRFFSENKEIIIRDTDYESAAAFKTAMSGVILNYELAEPQAQSPASVVPTDMVIQEGGTCEITYASGNDTPCDMALKLATSKIVEE